MARGFNTTFGSGTTDKIVVSVIPVPAVRTFFIRFYIRATPTVTDRFWDDESGANGTLCALTASNTILYKQNFNLGAGQWTVTPIPSLGGWHTLGISHDCSSDANDPDIYIDGTLQTESETSTPSGTSFASSVDLRIGNSTDDSRPWDGMLAGFALWNVALDASEHATLTGGWSPLLVRPTALIEFLPMVRDNVSIKRAAPTITGTAVQPHPRIIMSRRKRYPWLAETIQPETLFAQACL